MKLKKLPGFSLGLIALAVGNAYATQLLDDYSIISYMTDEESPIEIKDNNPISNGEYLTTEDESHAVKVDDGVTGYINNASVMTSGDGSIWRVNFRSVSSLKVSKRKNNLTI